MYDIALANEQSIIEIDESRLRKVVEYVLDAEEVREACISLAIVDDPTLRDLNRRHLDHDYDTDVLSFLLECDLPDEEAAGSTTPEAPRPRGYGKRIEGEVIVSAEMAATQAANFHWRPIDELTLYVVHGLLHLVGYDDLTDDERDVMRARERQLLNGLGIAPRDP